MAKTNDVKKQAILMRIKVYKDALAEANVKNAKVLFFDTVYGRLLKSESMSLDNMWAGKIANKKFADRLEIFTNETIKKKND